MCLAIPACVVEVLSPFVARVDLGGTRREVSTALLDGVAVGDYLLIHVGHALQKIDEAEAEKTLALMREVLAALEPVQT